MAVKYIPLLKFYSVYQFLPKFVTIFPIIPIEKVFLTFVANRENKIHSNSWKRKDTGREIFLQSHYVYICAKFDATIFFLFFTNFLFKIFLLPSA